MEVDLSGEPYLNSTYYVPLKKHLKENIFGNGKDIYITGLEIFKLNTSELYISIIDKPFNDKKSSMDCCLLGKKYSIIVHGSNIYDSTFHEGNLFPVNNIPFHLMEHHELSIVIREVNIPSSYYGSLFLKFHHIQSTKKYDVIDDQVNIRWPPFGTIMSPNYLTFMQGMCGMKKTSYGIDDDYLKKHVTLAETGKCKYDILSHLDKFNDYVAGCESYCDEYTVCYPLSVLISRGKDFLLETLKVPLDYMNAMFNLEQNNIKNYICTHDDALTNFKIITDQDISSVRMEYNGVSENFSVKLNDNECNGLKVYEVTAFSHINHFVIIGRNCNKFKITPIFTKQCINNISLIFDRCFYNIKLRSMVAQKQWNKQTLSQNIVNVDDVLSSVIFPMTNNPTINFALGDEIEFNEGGGFNIIADVSIGDDDNVTVNNAFIENDNGTQYIPLPTSNQVPLQI